MLPQKNAALNWLDLEENINYSENRKRKDGLRESVKYVILK